MIQRSSAIVSIPIIPITSLEEYDDGCQLCHFSCLDTCYLLLPATQKPSPNPSLVSILSTSRSTKDRITNTDERLLQQQSPEQRSSDILSPQTEVKLKPINNSSNISSTCQLRDAMLVSSIDWVIQKEKEE